MTLARPGSRAAAALVFAVLSACAPASFAPGFKPPARPEPERALEAVAKSQPREELAVAVGVTDEPAGLAAWSLDGKLLWEKPLRVESAPVIAGDAVVVQLAGATAVLALRDGRTRVTLDDEDGSRLVGADGDGERLVIARAFPERKSGIRGLLSFVRGDSVGWTRELPLAVGIPALSGNHVVVPWATNRLSILGIEGGNELARWYFIGSVLGQAQVDRGRVFVGQHGWLRVDEQLLRLDAEKVRPYAPLPRELPGQPAPLRDGYAPMAPPDDARHRVALDWRIGDDDRSALGDAAYLRFFRVLFALSASEDSVRWTRSFEEDLVGSAVTGAGVLVADAAGALRLFDGEGRQAMTLELGRRLKVLSLRPATWTMAATPEAQAAALPALVEQLSAIAALPDTRIVAARGYAVRQLARIDDAAVTAQLVAICSDSRSPEPLAREACSQVGERKTGSDAVLAALKPTSTGEGDAAPRQLGALAHAAGKMGLKTAAPWVLGYFEDLRTPASDLPAMADALAAFEYRPATEALERFVRLHHSEPSGSELAPALASATDALGTLRARSARPTLSAIAEDKNTPADLQQRAAAAIAAIDGPPPSKQRKPAAKPAAEAEPDTAPQKPAADPRPRALSTELVEQVLSPVTGKLQRCLERAGGESVTSSRVAMVVDREGQLEGIFVTPTSLQDCIEPVIRTRTFPATQLGRQRVTHVVSARPAKSAKPAKPAR